MSIKVVLSRAHSGLYEDPDVKQELADVQALVKDAVFEEDVVNFAFLEGMYDRIERKMDMVCLFVNKLGRSIVSLEGKIYPHFVNVQAEIADIEVHFDEDFLGVLGPDEAMLVHLFVPVRGLKENCVFKSDALGGSFEDVSVGLESDPSVTVEPTQEA